MNPSFEDVDNGSLPYWQKTAFAATSSTERVQSGERSIKLSSDKDSFSPTATQEITNFEQGQKYRLQYQARAAKFGQEYRVYIGVWKTDPQSGEKKWVDGIDTQWRQGLDAWQKISLDFTVKQPADMLMIVLESKGPGTMWFDSMSLQPAAEERLMEPVSPFVGSPKFVQIMPDRTFRVKGRPFFPIMLWGMQPNTEESMAQVRDAGFNIVNPNHIDGLGPDAFKLWLDTAGRYDLMVMATSWFALSDDMVESMLPKKIKAMTKVIEVAKTHPAFFGYGLADEPAWGGVNLGAYATGAHLFRSLDPNHPIFVNHAPRNTIAELSRYNRYTDIAGSDIYPVWKTGVDVHSDLPNKTIGVVGDETTKNLQAVDYKKPIIQTLQGFSWSDKTTDPALKDEPYPNYTQLRFMTYHTLVRGATGVAFFQDYRYPAVRPELKPIAREMQAMSDVLTSPTVEGLVVSDTPGIEALVKEYKGQRVWIVINTGKEPVNARLDLGRMPDSAALKGKVNVINEKRQVSLVNGGFEETFAPYAVRIYSTAANESTLSRTFKEPSSQKKPLTTEAVTAARRKQVDALAPDPKANLALGSRGVKVTASSLHPVYKTEGLVDGDRWGGAFNDLTPYTYPDWVALEFPQPVKIDKVVVFSHEVNYFNRPVNDGIRDYEVQVEEGGQWKTVAVVKDSQDFVRTIKLPRLVITSKLRLWITATNGDQDWTRLQEIEVYGPKRS